MSVRAPPGIPPTIPPGTPPTTPLALAGAGGACSGLPTGLTSAVLFGVYEDAGLGASSFLELAPDAAGGCRYSIVSVYLLGSGSVCSSGIMIRARTMTVRKANDPITAHEFRGRDSIT